MGKDKYKEFFKYLKDEGIITDQYDEESFDEYIFENFKAVLPQADVSGRSEQLKCPQCGCTETSSHSEGRICNNCKYVAWAF